LGVIQQFFLRPYEIELLQKRAPFGAPSDFFDPFVCEGKWVVTFVGALH
jgi:hypothetical protein